MNRQDLIDTIAELLLQNEDKLFRGLTLNQVVQLASHDIVSKYKNSLEYINENTPNLEQFTVEKCKEILAQDKDLFNDLRLFDFYAISPSSFKNVFKGREYRLLSNIPNLIIARFESKPKHVVNLVEFLLQEKNNYKIKHVNFFEPDNEIGQYLRQHDLMDDFIHWGQGKFFTGKDDKYKKFVEQKPMRKIMSFNGLFVIYENKLFDYEVNIEAVAKSSVDKIIDFPDQDIQKLVDTHSSEDEEPVKQIIALFCQKNLLEPNNVKIKGKIEFTQEHEDVLKQYNLQHLINKINTNKQYAKQLKVNL